MSVAVNRFSARKLNSIREPAGRVFILLLPETVLPQNRTAASACFASRYGATVATRTWDMSSRMDLCLPISGIALTRRPSFLPMNRILKGKPPPSPRGVFGELRVVSGRSREFSLPRSGTPAGLWQIPPTGTSVPGPPVMPKRYGSSTKAGSIRKTGKNWPASITYRRITGTFTTFPIQFRRTRFSTSPSYKISGCIYLKAGTGM